MEKKYQVFISSTFVDLQEERAEVIRAVLDLDCIPAGMEMFPAIDEDQFSFIKKVIDSCDYYILIVGGRYGSVAADGLSYTEKEYQYAREKGIKILAFLHSDINAIPLGRSELLPALREKLESFRKEIETGRLVHHWNTVQQLGSIVTISLFKTIKIYPALGWIRGGGPDEDPMLSVENESLKKENQELLEKLRAFNEGPGLPIDLSELAGLDDELSITGNYEHIGYPLEQHPWKRSLKWSEIFSLVAPHIVLPQPDSPMNKMLIEKLLTKFNYNDEFIDFFIDDEVIQTIKIHLKTLGFISVTTIAYETGQTLAWCLTNKGSRELAVLKGSKQMPKT